MRPWLNQQVTLEKLLVVEPPLGRSGLSLRSEGCELLVSSGEARLDGVASRSRKKSWEGCNNLLGRGTQPRPSPGTSCGTKRALSSRRDQTLCCRKDWLSSREVCASGKVRLALACHGFTCLLPFAGIACSQLFNQVAIPCVAGEDQGTSEKEGVLECPYTSLRLVR